MCARVNMFIATFVHRTYLISYGRQFRFYRVLMYSTNIIYTTKSEMHLFDFIVYEHEVLNMFEYNQ